MADGYEQLQDECKMLLP